MNYSRLAFLIFSLLFSALILSGCRVENAELNIEKNEEGESVELSVDSALEAKIAALLGIGYQKLNNELKSLKGRKIIYTNANKQHVVDVLQKINLSNFFDEIFDIKMADYIPKPEITPYEQIIKKYNLKPNSCAMFDDIAKNLVSAKKVGFTSIWIDAGYENFSDDIKSSNPSLRGIIRPSFL